MSELLTPFFLIGAIMINTEGLVLKLLMHSKESEQALLAFSRIKEKHFSESFKPVFTAIKDFYHEFNTLPSSNDISIYRGRSARVQVVLKSIQNLDITNLDLDVAVEALLDNHSQEVALDLITDFVDNVSLLSRNEMLDTLARLPIYFEQEIESPEKVLTAHELTAFKPKEDILKDAVLLGLSNTWDSKITCQIEDLILLGGRRGSGKSIVCSNIVANQMEQGNVGVYFTIEMTGQETFQRILSIVTGVNYGNIKAGEFSVEEQKTIAEWLASQYEDSEDILYEFLKSDDPDPYLFEKQLKSTCTPIKDSKLVVIDDRELSLASIDVQLSKLKAKYGDRFKVAVIDYVNQVVWDGHESEMYDWKIQTIIAKQLKNLARKYGILIVSPYQIDSTGEARLSKGILDACDTAQLLEPDKETSTITFIPSKVRSSSDEVTSTVAIAWNCLKIHPKEVNIDDLRPEEESKENTFPSGAGELV